MKVLKEKVTSQYAIYNADSCDCIGAIPDNSMDLSVYSPPFENLYIYSDRENDMGNAKDSDEFFQHYDFLIPEIHRITVPGRLSVVHCKDLPLYRGRDEVAGLRDFPGEIIRRHETAGWTFHSRVTIWKCPVTERERTNNNGLLHATALRDSSQLRQGMADYLLVFRKSPAQTESNLSLKPIERPNGFEFYVGSAQTDPRKTDYHPSKYARNRSGDDSRNSIEVWRRYAEPVWWDVDQTDVLNGWRDAKMGRDERHICPLQLGVIERSVHIWSNPGEVVYSPFAGIGSEGVGSIRRGRKFIGSELKEQYFTQSIKHLDRAVEESLQTTLF